MAFKPSITPPGTTAPAPTSPPSGGGGFLSNSTNTASTTTPRPPAGGGFQPRAPRPFPSRDRNFGNKDDKDGVRLNERIRVPNVRLIDENGGQVGIVPTVQALQMARDKGLDLMEVAATANPPVCKICDYGKHKYEQKKKEAVARKNQVIVKVKEVQLRPNTDQHDLDFKIKNSREFLEEGDKVKFTLMFRGREIAHTEPGFKMIHAIIEELKDVGMVESPPKLDGKKLIMILQPTPQTKKK
jgi:translation initiation factor IF-3